MGTREVPQVNHAGTRPVADDMTAVAGQTAGKESFVGRYSVAAYEPALGPAAWADKVKMSSDLARDSYKDEQALGSSMLRPKTMQNDTRKGSLPILALRGARGGGGKIVSGGYIMLGSKIEGLFQIIGSFTRR